jgi:hypothetical protein
MKIRIIFAIFVFLIFGVTAKRSFSSSVSIGGLYGLVSKSDIIASGNIMIKEGKTILVTNQILKGKAPKELTISSDPKTGWRKVDFIEDEYVLLFLKSIDAGNAKLTAGGTAKWPKANVGEYSNILSRASVASVADLANQILDIESKTDIDDRVDVLRDWLDSSDSLLNLIALQYALGGHIWSNEPSPDYQTSIDRNNILNGLSGYAFKLIQSDSPLIQSESIRLLRYADHEQALPILISKITDPNRNIREATCSELMSFSHRKDMEDNLNYRFNDSPEELLSVQRKWQEWYDSADFDK